MKYINGDKVWINNINNITDARLVRNPQVIETIDLAPVNGSNGGFEYKQIIYLADIGIAFMGEDLSPYTVEELNIPISEGDGEDMADIVYNNGTIKWTFNTERGIPVNITFMSDDEYEQRSRK